MEGLVAQFGEVDDDSLLAQIAGHPAVAEGWMADERAHGVAVGRRRGEVLCLTAWRAGGGRAFLEVVEQCPLGESPGGQMDLIYVEADKYVSGVELARIASFLKPGGQLVLVNYRGQLMGLKRQLEGCPGF